MRGATVCCIGLLSVALAHASQNQARHSLLLQRAQSVLRIEAPRVKGGFALGSGVVVDHERVVTNCHVTRSAHEIFVVRGGLRWAVRQQARDVERDLCLLDVPGLDAPVVPLGRADSLAPGQPVSALGYTGGMGLQNSAGEIVELHRHDGGLIVQSTNWFTSGASGGGLFDAQGRLIGILTFRLLGGQAHYFSAPVEWVQQLLGDHPRATLGPVARDDRQRLPFWQAPADQQPAFMQADRLLRVQRWDDLAAFAREWLKRAADDDEPWRLLGIALERLQRPQQARAALECSLRLTPQQPAVLALLNSMPETPTDAAASQPTDACVPGTL